MASQGNWAAENVGESDVARRRDHHTIYLSIHPDLFAAIKRGV
jgi:hypothetical protein